MTRLETLASRGAEEQGSRGAKDSLRLCVYPAGSLPSVARARPKSVLKSLAGRKPTPPRGVLQRGEPPQRTRSTFRKIQNRLSQSGFTIVESLVAMVIISILLTVIAPVIVLSVGNRVQARRVELASEAARTYIDGVESGIIEPPKHSITLDEVDDNKNFIPQRLLFAGVATPTGGLPCKANTTGNSYCSNTVTSSLYCIDLDRNGCSINSAKDLVVQAFRSFTPISTDDNRSLSPTSTDADKGYLLGIRVYRADAFSDDTPIAKSDSETKRTQLTFSGGLGNRKTPLVEMTTEIVTNATFRDMCDRLGCQDAQDAQDAQ